jgi:hypothetical protein
VTSRLTIAAPATLTVLAGNPTLSSLATLPPGGVAISGASAGVMSLRIRATDTAAHVTASGTGGATIVSAGNLLTLTGTELQINSALASLEVTEPLTVSQDALTLIATQTSLAATTGIAIDIIPSTGPAFVAPGTLVTVQPNALDSLPFLYLSDPIASGLAGIGLGREETLNLTLAVASGVLFLPGYTAASPVSATGIGTGEIILNLTADDIPELNSLLAGLEFAGPSIAGGEQFQFALRNLSGVLPYSLTRGNIFLSVAGAPGGAGTFTTGSQSFIEGQALLAGQFIADTLAVLGSIANAYDLVVSPSGNLELPYNALALGGTNLDFGTINADGLALSGDLVIGQTAAIEGPVLLEGGSLLDFTGFLNAGAAFAFTGVQAISLQAGAELTGNGTLLAGNFSESGQISGPGAILARGGETLLISAGSVGGFAQLDVAPGGVMVLGPISPLYGIFNTTPLVIDSSVTLNFQGNAGAAPITGGYAGTLGGDGGAFVISGPQVFSGQVENFQPGDELIFPGLTDVNVEPPSNNTFTVAGVDGASNTVTYVIRAGIPAGDTLVEGADAEGDPAVSLRPAAVTVSQAMLFEASAGVAQPLLGLSVELYAGTTHSLALTLSVAEGVLSDGTLSGAAITLTAGGIAAMNTALAALNYIGTGADDSLGIVSTSGVLAGLSDTFALYAAPPGIINGDGLPAFSEAQLASFGDGGLVFSLPATAGEVQVTGISEFAGPVQADGIGGTALVVDGGGTAIFNAASSVTLGANATLGDANGPGTLAVLTDAFTGTGNLTLAAGSAAYVPGAITLGGSLEAAGLFALSGTLAAAAISLDAGGTLLTQGYIAAGNFYDTGTITLFGTADAQSGSAYEQGGTLCLGGTSSLGITGGLELVNGVTQIGPDAVVNAASVLLSAGTLTVAGLLESATLNLFGGLFLAGGTLDVPSIALGGQLTGYGVVDAATLSAGNILVAQGGELAVGGSLGPNVEPEIAAGAVLDLAGGFTSSAIMFLGGDALLTVGDPAAFAATPVNFVATDALDLVGVNPGQVTYSGGTGGNLTVYDGSGHLLTHFGMEIAPGQPGVSIVSDNAGGALITLGDELPCFTRGTGLLTPHGYRPVESLKPGDPLITASGVSRPVRWIGRRTLDLGPRAARFALPVLIMPGAFGPGLPARRLRLSPLHCVFADGALFPVTHLVNGATILRDDASAAMTYYHVELDRHDILLAEGLPCESYFDSGNRGGLYQEVGRRCPAAGPYAPSVTRGAALARLRRRLHQVALAAGFSLTYWPSLRAVAGGQGALAEITRLGRWRMARFCFAAPVRELTLLSGVACPADTDPDSEDRRELGVCLDQIGGIRLGAGFYPRAPADDGHWMGRVAALHLDAPAMEVTLPLAAIVQSWVRK